MGLDESVAPDVVHLNAPREQGGGEKQAAVAVQRVFLGAQEGDAESSAFELNSLDGLDKGPRFGQNLVHDAPGRVVEAPVRRASSEGGAEKPVLNAGLTHGLGQRFSIEMWISRGVGRGAHIGQRINVITPEERGEILNGMGGMANGKHAFHSRFKSRLSFFLFSVTPVRP